MNARRIEGRGSPLAALVALVVLVVSAVPRPALAHLMPAEQATLNVVGDSVFAVVAVPVSALHGFDDDGDGLMEMVELDRHQAELRKEIERRFEVSSGDVAGTEERVDLVLSPEHEAARDRAGAVVALVHTRFAAEPRELRLDTDLFAPGPDAHLTVTATHQVLADKAAETSTLTRAAPSHRFFRPAGASAMDALGLAVAAGTGLLLLLRLARMARTPTASGATPGRTYHVCIPACLHAFRRQHPPTLRRRRTSHDAKAW